jgi:uncharacterized protein DUF5655
MNKAIERFTTRSHFEGKDPIVRKIYDSLIKNLKKIGPLVEDPKKTSIHINNKTALAGVATRKAHLILTIKSDRKLASPRIHKSEQVSAHRFHHEVKLTSVSDVDEELMSWLRNAYEMSA